MNPADIIALVSLIFIGCGALGGTAWKIVNYVNGQVTAQAKKVDDEMIIVRAEIRTVDEKRSANARELHSKIDHSVESLDEKFNLIRESIAKITDNMVRRDDLNGHLNRIERAIESTTLGIDKLREQLMDSVVKKT